MSAPAWLGIGAQRSGTTWFTDLLTQHPQVGLGTNGKKEQHLLHKVADGVLPAADYLELFPDDGMRRGEWTPQYLRHASVPGAAARLVPDPLETEVRVARTQLLGPAQRDRAELAVGESGERGVEGLHAAHSKRP